MADLNAGTIIRGVDTPPAGHDDNASAQSNISATSWTAGSPEVGVAFTAPTSERVLIAIAGGLRAQTTGEFVQMTVEIFAGTDSTGTKVQAPASAKGIRVPYEASNGNYCYLGRTELYEGIFTAGSDYFARLVHEVSGGSTADINHRSINVIPTS